MIKILPPFIMVLVALNAVSQEKTNTEQIVTDRPDLTESSRTVPHKSIQIETGLLMFVEIPSETSEFKTTLLQFPGTFVRFGFFKNVELRLFNQFVNEKSNDPTLPIKNRSTFGIDNLAVGTKIDITSEKGLRPEIALMSHIVLPLGSNEFKNNKTLFNIVFSLSNTLTNKFSLGYNLGWTSDDNPNGSGLYTLALGYTIFTDLGFYIEGYGILKNMQTATLGLDGGFTYLINNKIQLDVSAGKGVTENNYFVSTGISILIPNVF